ncbi:MULTISPECIES: hypothetical protein [Nocardiaceae]|uniref:hypothetical protein n=1 Tax=Nocardiaceae TaxID=85025 RepID=UPI00050BFAA1|nr:MULTISPECIES: hypothetical protein [Rhodococcus]OZD04245.1 hypothetical protein CH275_13345 [Rhodococcus sp. 06-235-1A]OZD77236.1 hypothetical protein CH258_27110 [Rhodococcus sp. 05-2256-B4]OZD88355.1 hypothetical protein CH257_22905 [Rhodococcus sp. 05-2256-B3]OZD98488.1 hypothetical protein CH260_08355 [Rhodococcus sp. 05-2256-B2]OZE05305.1 hypothetical protein CH285_06370 [Rhodococcus sp. 05-2256-B1]
MLSCALFVVWEGQDVWKQDEEFPIDADLDIITAHGSLDVRAASIDWDDDAALSAGDGRFRDGGFCSTRW